VEWTINSKARTLMSQSGIFGELWSYMKVRRKWWLLPIIVVLLLVGMLLVFAQGSVLAPFIYTVF
jgi:hypothetical protein